MAHQMFRALDHIFWMMIIIEEKIDLPSVSMSLPSSFACFSFLSIALLIFCDHHGDDGEDLLTMTMNMVTIMTMMMTMTTKEPEHDPHKSLQASSLSAYAGQCPSLIIKMTMHRFS